MKRLKILLTAFAASALLAVPISVSALEIQQDHAQKKAEFDKRRQEAKNKVTTKQDEAKKKACEKRSESFKKRMQGIADRSERRVEVFNKIAEQVQDFAKGKKVVVANYDELITDVNLKREALRQAHELARENAGLFQCGGDNAKTNVAIFKQTIQDEHQAFKDYRESIKNLIKSVKQAIQASKPGENNAQ